MTDALEKIIRPIVEGQIRGFLKEHPKIIAAVDWFKPRDDKATTFVNSLSKRITRDLVCANSRARIGVALLESCAGTAPISAVEPRYCDERRLLGNISEQSSAAHDWQCEGYAE